MNCNPEIHNEMITIEYIDCLFCDQHLQQPSLKMTLVVINPHLWQMITVLIHAKAVVQWLGSWRNQFMRENITWKILSIISMINTDYISAKSW